MPYRKRNKPNRIGTRKCEDRLGTSLAYRKEIKWIKRVTLSRAKILLYVRERLPTIKVHPLYNGGTPPTISGSKEALHLSIKKWIKTPTQVI